MDILSTLRRKIAELPLGARLSGLQAVERHVRAGFRHFERGQRDLDESAFIDAVYRSNQAYEGAIREAYRVLAASKKERLSTFEIENYLTTNKVLRPRVLAQLSTYRRDWRNPSTHDHTLDFDESEALLALVSVSTFACVLTDQIAGHLAYTASKQKLSHDVEPSIAARKNFANLPLYEQVASGVAAFANSDHLTDQPPAESQIVGALAAYLTAYAPELKIEVGEEMPGVFRRWRPDIVARRNDQVVIIEVKRHRPGHGSFYKSETINLLMEAVSDIGASHAVVLFASDEAPGYGVARVDSAKPITFVCPPHAS